MDRTYVLPIGKEPVAVRTVNTWRTERFGSTVFFFFSGDFATISQVFRGHVNVFLGFCCLNLLKGLGLLHFGEPKQQEIPRCVQRFGFCFQPPPERVKIAPTDTSKNTQTTPSNTHNTPRYTATKHPAKPPTSFQTS